MPNQTCPLREHVWSGFQARETTRKPAVHREQKGAQTLLCPLYPIGLSEEKASVPFLSKDALGLLFVPRVEFTFPECSSQKLFIGRF